MENRIPYLIPLDAFCVKMHISQMPLELWDNLVTTIKHYVQFLQYFFPIFYLSQQGYTNLFQKISTQFLFWSILPGFGTNLDLWWLGTKLLICIYILNCRSNAAHSWKTFKRNAFKSLDFPLKVLYWPLVELQICCRFIFLSSLLKVIASFEIRGKFCIILLNLTLLLFHSQAWFILYAPHPHLFRSRAASAQIPQSTRNHTSLTLFQLLPWSYCKNKTK